VNRNEGNEGKTLLRCLRLLCWKLLSGRGSGGEPFIREIREIRGSIPLLAVGRLGRLSCSLCGEQAVQVSNDQGIAEIPGNPHFPVDISCIQAYHSIVKMGNK
jgi:hypothetical protein